MIERQVIFQHSFLGRKPAFTFGLGFVYPFCIRTDSAAGAAGRCQVTLHPFLLGRKFQKAADKAVLKKNGAFEPKNTEKVTPSAACIMRRIAQPSSYPSGERCNGGVGAVSEASFRTQRQKNLPQVIG